MSKKSPGKGEPTAEEIAAAVTGEHPPNVSAIAAAISGVPQLDPFSYGRPLDPQPPTTDEEAKLTGEEFGE